MAIRTPVVVFLSRKNEGCPSDHEVLDEEQEKKVFCIRRTSRGKA
jgi:hypothetical protein